MTSRKKRIVDEDAHDDLFDDHPISECIEPPNFKKQREEWLKGDNKRVFKKEKHGGTKYEGLYEWTQDIHTITITIDEEAIRRGFKELQSCRWALDRQHKMENYDADVNQQYIEHYIEGVTGPYHCQTKLKQYQKEGFPTYMRRQFPDLSPQQICEKYIKKSEGPNTKAIHQTLEDDPPTNVEIPFTLENLVKEKRLRVSFGYSDLIIYMVTNNKVKHKTKYGVVTEPETITLFKRGLEQPIKHSECEWFVREPSESPNNTYSVVIECDKLEKGWWRKAFVENALQEWQFQDPKDDNDDREINIRQLRRPSWFNHPMQKSDKLQEMIHQSRLNRGRIRPFLNQSFLPTYVPLKDMIHTLNIIWELYDTS